MKQNEAHDILKCDEVIKQINETNDFEELRDIWNVIAQNKYKYTLVELKAMTAEMKKRILVSNGSEIDKGSFYLHLMQIV